MIAGSLGRRASNSSATRGRPPVMSRVLLASRGRRASTSPAWTLSAVLDRHDRADRQVVARLAARRQRDRVAVLVLQHDRRPQVARAGVLAPVDHLLAGLAGGLVDHLAERGAVDQVLEHDGARGLGDHRQGVRIPLGQHLPLLDLRVGLDPQPGAVGQLLAQLLAADLVVDHELGVAAEDDLAAPCCRAPGAG